MLLVKIACGQKVCAGAKGVVLHLVRRVVVRFGSECKEMGIVYQVMRAISSSKT